MSRLTPSDGMFLLCNSGPIALWEERATTMWNMLSSRSHVIGGEHDGDHPIVTNPRAGARELGASRNQAMATLMERADVLEGDGYCVIDGVATIDVLGELVKRPLPALGSFAPTSTTEVQGRVSDALNDPRVRAIMLVIDSPGGTVDGTFELSEWLGEQRGVKPLAAFCDGMACSAAYTIASAVDPGRLFAFPTSLVGSIAVIQLRPDTSRMWDREGVTINVLRSDGDDLKASELDVEPLEGERYAELQGRIDALGERMRAMIGAHRGMPEDSIRALRGRAMLAVEAIDVGLVDEVMRLEQAIVRLASEVDGGPASDTLIGDQTIHQPRRAEPVASASEDQTMPGTATAKPSALRQPRAATAARLGLTKPKAMEGEPDEQHDRETLEAIKARNPELYREVGAQDEPEKKPEDEPAMEEEPKKPDDEPASSTPEEDDAFKPDAKAKAAAGPAATLAELRDTFPGEANAAFVLGQLEAGATMQQAAKAFAALSRDREAKARSAGAIDRAADGVAPVGEAGSATASGGIPDSPEAAWKLPQVSQHPMFAGFNGKPDASLFNRYVARCKAEGSDWRSGLQRPK